MDVSPLVHTRAGTAHYINGLLAGLREEDDVEVRPLTWGGTGRAATLARELGWHLAALPVQARRARLELLHCTTYRGPIRAPVPTVVTVHDLAVFRHPRAFPLWTRTAARSLVPLVVRAARLVIAVSDFTRSELRELLGVRDEQIRVVPNAVESTFRPDGPRALGEYVLAVGTLEPRKNLPRLVEATRHLGVELRVVGAAGWGRVRVDAAHVRLLGEVDDEELATLYRGARAFAYPSLYEGFGIPILEAMACGAPVVTSAGGATEETAGGAAVLVDPRDPAAIAAGLEEAVSRRDELVPLGLARARQFSWRDVAGRTAAVYREAV